MTRTTFAVVVGLALAVSVTGPATAAPSPAQDACPPFHLRGADGAVINPVDDATVDVPYSPKQTCGGCHDYDLITQGYHFQQGKDEEPSDKLKQLYRWVSSPGDYGGRW